MKTSDLELMLFHDGELDAEGVRRVRVARLHHPEVLSRLDGVEQLGAFVRMWAENAGVDPSGPRREAERARCRRRTQRAGQTALLAAAACVWMLSAAPPSPSAAAAPVATSSAPTPTSRHDFAASVEIEAVEFGAHGGAVFFVETEARQLAVVWLTDAAEEDTVGTL